MVPESELQRIEAVVARYPDGVGVRRIVQELDHAVPRRTLQYRLRGLVAAGRIDRRGAGRSTRYLPRSIIEARMTPGVEDVGGRRDVVPRELAELHDDLRKAHLALPVERRRPVGYHQAFLDDYRPNVSAYLSGEERAALRRMG